MTARRSKGEGTVFQRHARDCRRKTGSSTCICPWYAQVDHGWIGGKRVRPARAATRDDGQRPTKQDAIRTRDAMLLEMRAGVVTSASTMDQWLTYWLDNIIAHANLKPSTRTYYTQYTEQWLKPVLGKVRLDKLGPEHVRGLHEAMRKAGKSPTTIRNAHAALRKALGAALTERRVAYNWAREVSAPSASGEHHDQLSALEAGKVFVAAATDARTLARVHVAILCGLRQGEALALRWEDVDLKAGVIAVRWSAARVDGSMVRQRPKTRRSIRDVPIAEAARQSLQQWHAESGGQGYVFHGFAGPEVIEGAERDYRAWQAILSAARVSKVPLHGARGTCASILEGLGYPPRLIADILGQADVRITEEHYTRSDPEQRAAAMDSVSDAVMAAITAAPLTPPAESDKIVTSEGSKRLNLQARKAPK